jgi:hypothetical protein
MRGNRVATSRAGTTPRSPSPEAGRRRDVARREASQEKDDFEARIAAEVERRISQMYRFAGHGTPPPDDEFTNVANDFDASGCDIAFAP